MGHDPEQELIARAKALLSAGSGTRGAVDELLTECAAIRLRLQARILRLGRQAQGGRADETAGPRANAAAGRGAAEAGGEAIDTAEQIAELSERSERLMEVIGGLRRLRSRS